MPVNGVNSDPSSSASICQFAVSVLTDRKRPPCAPQDQPSNQTVIACLPTLQVPRRLVRNSIFWANSFISHRSLNVLLTYDIVAVTELDNIPRFKGMKSSFELFDFSEFLTEAFLPWETCTIGLRLLLQVWWHLILLLLATHASTCLQHSHNLEHWAHLCRWVLKILNVQSISEKRKVHWPSVSCCNDGGRE